MSDDQIYAQIAEELETDALDKATWARAMAMTEGDAARTKAFYIRLRHQALSAPASPRGAASSRIGFAQVTDTERTRAELARLLNDKNLSSLYATLGATADASDDHIREVIKATDERIRQGYDVASPEYTYARDTLGDPVRRREYDAKLFAKAADLPLAIMTADGHGASFLSWWESRKTTFIIFAVVALSALVIWVNYERNLHIARMQAAAIEASKAAYEMLGENQRAAIDHHQRFMEQSALNAGDADRRRTDVMTREQERRARELDYRANAEARSRELRKQREQQRLEAEKARSLRMEIAARERKNAEEARQAEITAQRERRYWSCMNSELSRANASVASARCRHYR